jgi:spermidine synthase
MTKDGLYFLESYTDELIRKIKVERVIFEGQTKYQYVQIFENRMLGKMLFLDKKIQSAAIDERIYHESLVHPAMMTHPDPRNILIIGGGEGATLRETLRHKSVKKATMVDIDRQLVRLCQEHLPEWSSGAFEDPRALILFKDASTYVEKCRKKFDVIISDLTEPLENGPSINLFTKEFFQKVSRLLTDDGVFVLQAGSTDISYNKFFSSCARTLQLVFPVVRPYWNFMFSFYSPWGFVLASRKHDPLHRDETTFKKRFKDQKIKMLTYYHPGIHSGLFALPMYLERALKKGDILTKKDPFIWEI